jgi:hypothetical protein
MFGEAIGDISLAKLERINSLTNVPLWQAGTPVWFSRAYEKLKANLQSAGQGWSVWTDWYEAILAGKPTPGGDELELYRITLDSEDDWAKGPAHVNALIRKKQEEIEARNRPASSPEEPDLTQRPAGHVFDFESGKLVAKPVLGRPDNELIAQDLRNESIDKLRAAAERLSRTQVSSRFSGSFDMAAAFLGEHSISDIPLGKLLSICRTLDVDAGLLASPDLRQMMDEDVQAIVADAVRTLEDFKALFPEIIKIEASQLALRLATKDAVSVNATLETFSLTIAHQTDVVSPSAIAAIDESKSDIGDLDKVISEATTEEAIAVAVEARAGLVGQRLMQVRNFTARALKEAGVRVAKGAGDGLEKATADVVEGTVKGGVTVLVGLIAGPLAALAVLVPMIKPFSRKAEEVKKQSETPDDMANV